MATNPNYYPSPPPSSGNTGGGSWVPGAVSGLFSSLISARQQKKEREHRTLTEEDRRRYDRERWDEYNRYNHPIAQRQRLEEAGLNPNLIYGSSPGSAVGNAGQQPTAKAPEINYTNWAQPGIDTYQNVRVQQAQTNNLRAQANLNNVSAMEGLEKTGIAKADKINKQNLLAGNLELQEHQITQAQQKAFQSILQTKAWSHETKGLVARYAAETETAFAKKNQEEYKVAIEKLTSTLAKKGIRPTDNMYVRIMAQIFDLDLSKPIDKKQLQTLETWIRNPFNTLN